VNIGTAIRSAGSVLLKRPASVLPVYLLVLGITAITRVPVLVGIAVALGLLIADGRLQALFEAIEAVDFEALEEPGAEGELDTVGIPGELETAVLDILSIEIVAIVGLAAVGAVVVGIVSNGLSNAAAINGSTVVCTTATGSLMRLSASVETGKRSSGSRLCRWLSFSSESCRLSSA